LLIFQRRSSAARNKISARANTHALRFFIGIIPSGQESEMASA
jgi:hypothetical protein